MNTDKPAQVVLKNVSVKWAKLIRPGQAFDEGQPDLWSVNMFVTPEDHKKLLDLGCEAKKSDKDDALFFVAKRNVKNKKGDPVPPPALVDGRKQPMTEEVGNGSVCNIAVTPFEWKKGQREGVLLYLNAVQVVNYLPASNGVDAFDVIDDAQAASNDKTDDGDGLPF